MGAFRTQAKRSVRAGRPREGKKRFRVERGFQGRRTSERASTSTSTSDLFDLPPLRPQSLLHSSDWSPVELNCFDVSSFVFTFFGSAGAGLAAGAPNPFFFAAAALTIDGRCRRRDTFREGPPCRSGQVSTTPARQDRGMLEDAPQPAAVGGESALRERIPPETIEGESSKNR